MKLTNKKKDGTHVQVEKQLRGDKLKLKVTERLPDGKRHTYEESHDVPNTPKGESNAKRTEFVQNAVNAALKGKTVSKPEAGKQDQSGGKTTSDSVAKGGG